MTDKRKQYANYLPVFFKQKTYQRTASTPEKKQLLFLSCVDLEKMACCFKILIVTE